MGGGPGRSGGRAACNWRPTGTYWGLQAGLTGKAYQSGLMGNALRPSLPYMWTRAYWTHSCDPGPIGPICMYIYIYIYSLCILIYFRYSPIMPFRIPFARQGSNIYIYIYIYSYIFGQNSRFALDCRCSSGVCQPVTNFYRFFWFSYRHGRWGPFSDFFWKGCLA